ncbi:MULTISPECIES: hypothetical protein [unclassified Sphingomonas]|uniref:hypothetical protein n=1 Tax=unclassified Sphingomonas TaxID=196159 RepID=UPI001F5A240B|nr:MULTISPECIES: hypothetical protein [unclassified Sphingomonas]
MPTMPYLADPKAVHDAAELIALHGPAAAEEAALRADRSRDIGNVVHFCRWRQIERLIAVMAAPGALGTVH